MNRGKWFFSWLLSAHIEASTQTPFSSFPDDDAHFMPETSAPSGISWFAREWQTKGRLLGSRHLSHRGERD